MKQKSEMSYEEALAGIDKIVSELESSDIKMDDMASKLREAGELLSFCRKMLDGYSSEFEKIVDNGLKEEL